MTREEFDTLRSDAVRRAIADNLDRDPLDVALDRRIDHAAVVATQIKYLRRARTKLPSYHAARCILPPLAFEQASSELCAAHKRPEGDTALDLTCGLGVDAVALSRRFRRVVALERDAVLADITAYNLQLLGIKNVEVIHASAEEYLAETDERFDWIYADPDRRSAAGRKLVRLEECSPDILRLRPLIQRCSRRLCVKNSPLFDVDEALRLFPTAHVEAVSLHGECKELLIYDDGTGPLLTATAIGMGSVTFPPAETAAPAQPTFESAACGYLFLPDVALQKMRLVRRALAGKADAWSENGFAFACRPVEGVPGRNFAITAIEPFNAKTLRRSLRGKGVEVLLREFPLSAAEIQTRTGSHAGSELRLAFTRIGGKAWMIQLGEEVN